MKNEILSKVAYHTVIWPGLFFIWLLFGFLSLIRKSSEDVMDAIRNG